MENGGQWDKEALYFSQTPNLNLWVTKHGLRSEYFGLTKGKDGSEKTGQVIDMAFVGSQMKGAVGSNKIKAVTQFIKPEGTSTAFSYRSVMLDEVYPGVDMKVYTENGRPRYDLHVAPGADPAKIQMLFRGADGVQVDRDGRLALGTRKGSFEHRGLYAYQIKNGAKQQVSAKFVEKTPNTVSFELGNYDASAELVIDPIVYGSYWGGDAGTDEVRAVTADADAGIYFTGSTQAPDLPVLFGPFSVNITGNSDMYIAKLRGDAYVHEYSAFIGGSGRETGKFIAMAPSGNRVWIAGTTSSADFPGAAGSLQPAISGAVDGFVVGFDKNATTILAHGYSTYYGGAGATEQLTGFAVAPVTGDLVLGGHSSAVVPGSGAHPGAATNAWVTRLNPTGQTILWSQFYGTSGGRQVSGFNAGSMASLNGGKTGMEAAGPLSQDTPSVLTGSSVAVDANDNVLITGTVFSLVNQDTATAGAPVFVTTPGVFPGGRLLRFNDVYVAKFLPTGVVVYAALLGGNGNDAASAICTDESGNAYLTGIAASADFPRTTGTFGQTFTSAANVFVTKISTNGSEIVYSTNLRTAGNIFPQGIAVNQRGFAFVTGIVDCSVTFPDPPGMPGDPNLPTGSATGTIQTTADALRTANTFPGPGDLPATDGFLNILDSTAETLLFGTYIGGNLDDVAFAPFVDRIGDVWVMGYSDSRRSYFRSNAAMTGGTNFLVTDGGLVAGFITPLAFKSVIESAFGAGGTTFNVVPYGSRYTPFTTPPTINGVTRIRDGYLFRFRLDVPLVTNLTLAPSSIAGGLGTTSIGTVTISGPAPAEGVDVVVSIDNTAGASLADGSDVAQLIVPITAGQTTATFTLFTKVVIDPTQVEVKADYLGSFKIAQLTVNPWLSQLTLNPTTVSSGSQSIGRVTLFQVATEDVVVALSTDNPSLISFPNGNTVTVAAGQQSANFPIQTATVDTQLQGNVSASFLGRTRTQVLTVRPAILQSLSFTPNRVAGGGSSIGTVTLDGNAPSTGAVVSLSVFQNPANINTLPPTVTVLANQRTATFTVTTNLVASNTFSVIRSSYNLTNRDATLLIDNISLSNFTINPTTVNGGGSVTGTVTLNQPAPPGGAFVDLATASVNVVLPDEDPSTAGNQVLVAANNTSRSFTIGTLGTVSAEVAVISASRGGAPINRNLTINPVDFTVSITPSSVLGGNGATMTITLTGPAPLTGVPFVITKSSVLPNPPDNSGAVTVNGGNPVLIPSGQTTANFPITTTSVSQTDTVTVTATITASGFNHSANLQVRAPRVVGVQFIPSVVRGLFTTTMRLTLDGPAPVGGANVTITKAPNAQIANIPGAVNIPAGNTQWDTVISTNKVARSLATNVTATYGGASAAATLTVTR